MSSDFYHFLFGPLMVPALIGLFVLFHVLRQQKHPADASNRINKIRLIWFALTREHLIARYVEWLRKDEFQNIYQRVMETPVEPAFYMSRSEFQKLCETAGIVEQSLYTYEELLDQVKYLRGLYDTYDLPKYNKSDADFTEPPSK